jgi:threonine dehydrogenase-like Zn-dependent dehydrogenase
MEQVRRGRVDVRSLVTDMVDAADVAAIFERLDKNDPEILQAVLRFPAAPVSA